MHKHSDPTDIIAAIFVILLGIVALAVAVGLAALIWVGVAALGRVIG